MAGDRVGPNEDMVAIVSVNDAKEKLEIPEVQSKSGCKRRSSRSTVLSETLMRFRCNQLGGRVIFD